MGCKCELTQSLLSAPNKPKITGARSRGVILSVHDESSRCKFCNTNLKLSNQQEHDVACDSGPSAKGCSRSVYTLKSSSVVANFHHSHHCLSRANPMGSLLCDVFGTLRFTSGRKVESQVGSSPCLCADVEQELLLFWRGDVEAGIINGNGSRGVEVSSHLALVDEPVQLYVHSESRSALSPSTKNAEDNGDNFAHCNLSHRTSRCTHSPSRIPCSTSPLSWQGTLPGQWEMQLERTTPRHTQGAVESITGISVTITRNWLKESVHDVNCCGRIAGRDKHPIFLVRGSCRAQCRLRAPLSYPLPSL